MRMRNITVALTLALREIRSGKRGFTVFLGCLILGVFAIAAVGSVSESARTALARDARVLLGGDVSILLATPEPTPEQLAWTKQHGSISRSLSLRAMARRVDPTHQAPATSSEVTNPAGTVAYHTSSTLVALKGIDDQYPLYGTLDLSPPLSTHEALEEKNGIFGAVVEPILLDRLGIKLNDRITIGTQQFEVRATITREPDRTLQGFTFGPRILTSIEGVTKTDLLIPGSLIRSRIKIRLSSANTKNQAASEQVVSDFITQTTDRFPDSGLRMRSFSRAAPRMTNALNKLDIDLMLIGLAALLVGGLGIAEAVRGYLESRIQHIATMKCVGGDIPTVFTTYFFQIFGMGAVGIFVGCIAGASMPLLVSCLLQNLLPVPIEGGIHWAALGRAAILGFAIIFAFSLRPLLMAGSVSPAVLFRGYTGGNDLSLTTMHKVYIIFAFAGLAALVFYYTPSTKLALGFIGLTAGCFIVFRLVAWGMQVLSKRLPPIGSPSIRLGLSSIHRPGAPTVSLVFALGLGLTALVAISQVEQNLTANLERDLSKDAPAFFFINILPKQRLAFEEVVKSHAVPRMEQGPMVRGRITHINNVPVEQMEIAPGARWALRGDRGLSHAATLPEGTKLVAGNWWPADYSGAPTISLTKDLADGFGVSVGDTLSFNILGRGVTATIANIREVNWMTFQLQFAVLFAPGFLDKAPVTWIATVYGNDTEELYAQITATFPNVTAFSMRAILSDVQRIMHRVSDVFRGMASVMLITGFLVLAGAITADRHRRIYDAVIYKVCGATTGDIVKALVTEFLAVGLATGIFSALTGSVAAWAAIEGLMEMSFSLHPAALLLTIASGAGFALLFGLAGTARALHKKPAPYLRND